ncbi:MAG: hypothetical protein RSP_04880 [Rhodanobacter sp.]
MTSTTLHTAATSPAGNNLLETFLGLCLITLLGAGAWSLFASMPAYGGQPTPPAATAHFSVPALAPLCFDRTREQVLAQGVEAGCPTDPMAYRPVTLRHNG